jgi:hypothetical protein
VDAGALARCQAVHPHCYLLEVKSADVTSANRFMTKSYLELVWAKLSLQQRVLELGYNYLFTVSYLHNSIHAVYSLFHVVFQFTCPRRNW